MKEIDDEIKQTLNLMRTDVSDIAHEELQFHLYNLLGMKRDRLAAGNNQEPDRSIEAQNYNMFGRAKGAPEMKELNEEINQTIDLMQTAKAQAVRDELQHHLYGLLEIKRNEMQRILTERSQSETISGISSTIETVTHTPSPYESFIELLDTPLSVDGLGSRYTVAPLSTEELKAGGWWCTDVSEESRLAFTKKGLNTRSANWSDDCYKYCYLAGSELESSEVFRTDFVPNGLKQIHRVGNDFYWRKKNEFR